MPSLIPDHYEVQAQMTGFETAARRGIQLTVGSDLEINMVLNVGQVTQMTA
ncbi:MAG: carboxypeptidase regulatory-like domain-containing protein [Acidobacteria bacterium]|nr:carboxypeptidase regulatory-like domain-containing protein [Acidobacteriota bacterium]